MFAMSRSWHVYAARGRECASADFPAQSAKEAMETASKVWGIKLENLTAHRSIECKRQGCEG
jgi:hypothetical protein